MIKVNKELCIGCGTCAALCPKTFRLGSEGKSEVVSPSSAEASAGKQDDTICAKKAAESCPTQAISVS